MFYHVGDIPNAHIKFDNNRFSSFGDYRSIYKLDADVADRPCDVFLVLRNLKYICKGDFL